MKRAKIRSLEIRNSSIRIRPRMSPFDFYGQVKYDDSIHMDVDGTAGKISNSQGTIYVPARQKLHLKYWDKESRIDNELAFLYFECDNVKNHPSITMGKSKSNLSDVSIDSLILGVTSGVSLSVGMALGLPVQECWEYVVSGSAGFTAGFRRNEGEGTNLRATAVGLGSVIADEASGLAWYKPGTHLGVALLGYCIGNVVVRPLFKR